MAGMNLPATLPAALSAALSAHAARLGAAAPAQAARATQRTRSPKVGGGAGCSSALGVCGVSAAANFQGYVIAQCNFQYAHGFAFISDVGANRVSEAYLGLILDSALPSRTLFASEILGH